MDAMHAQGWFERWFLAHYPEEVRRDYHRFVDTDANPANNPSITGHLAEGAALFARNAPALLGTELSFDGAGVAKLATALDRKRRDAWVANSSPDDPGNMLFNAVIHGALFVGECAVRAHGCAWSARNPLWESRVDRFVREGTKARAIGPFSPFQWLLKHLDDREIDAPRLADRFRVHVEFATADVASYPPVVTAPKLPKIDGGEYDLLVKFLHRHAPTLKDLGPLFPSVSEWSALGYKSLGFESFFDGRVVALHALFAPIDSDPHGDNATVDVYWLTAEGAQRIDRVPCAAHPPYFARKTGDTLEVTVSFQGKPHTHRIGYRGHG
ncbi:MAG: hypothetical protein JNK05_37450 [Myxococcales bacterium]|nr:hypothetical protein [Myxococcales bacterium]